MIQANELRIGNYILGQTKQITKVDAFFNQNKAIYTNVEDDRVRFIIHYLSECEGVELTEEILLKCGFVKQTAVFSFGEDLVIGIGFDFVGIYINKIEEDIQLDCPKYFHQLQNLYFTLTGKELEINL